MFGSSEERSRLRARALLVGVALVGFSACIDFDALAANELGRLEDAGVDAGTGGGVATGGGVGSDGGATTGGGTATGGGVGSGGVGRLVVASRRVVEVRPASRSVAPSWACRGARSGSRSTVPRR